MRTALIALVIFIAALVAGCEREEDRPVVQPGAAPSINLEGEIRVLQNVVRDDPQNVQAWVKLGNFLMDSNRCTEAIEAYGKALELDPSDNNARVDKGTCYRRIGRPDMAAEHFREAIEVDPAHPFAHRNLGVVLAFDMRKYKEGREEFEKYLELSPAASDRAQIEKIISDLKAAEKGGATP